MDTARTVAVANQRVSIALPGGVLHMRGGDILDGPGDVAIAAMSPNKFHLVPVATDEDLEALRTLIADERKALVQKARELGFRLEIDR